MGYENRDCNGATQTGFMLPQATIRRGARCSQFYYLHFVRSTRCDLISTDIQATENWKKMKILFKNVFLYLYTEMKEIFHARKEMKSVLKMKMKTDNIDI